MRHGPATDRERCAHTRDGAAFGSGAWQVELDAAVDHLRVVEYLFERVDRAGRHAGITPPAGILDRGRRTIAVDLKSPEGAQVVRDLAAEADVFVEGFRPGVAERIGISETQLSLLRTGKVKGMRFDTLSKLCLVLDCAPGDILDYDRDEADLIVRDVD